MLRWRLVHIVFLVVIVVRVFNCDYFVAAAWLLLSSHWAHCHAIRALVVVCIGSKHKLIWMTHWSNLRLALHLRPDSRLRDLVKTQLLPERLLTSASKSFLCLFLIDGDTKQLLNAVLLILLIVDCSQISPTCSLRFILMVSQVTHIAQLLILLRIALQWIFPKLHHLWIWLDYT